jgi:hypothetical protein
LEALRDLASVIRNIGDSRDVTSLLRRAFAAES